MLLVFKTKNSLGMYQLKIALFFLIVFAFGCENSNNCQDSKRAYKLLPDSHIIHSFDTIQGYPITLYKIEEGQKIVASYRFDGARCDYIADDEYANSLSFHFDKNLETFEFKDEEIANTNFFYFESGAWVNSTRYSSKKGLISGTKLDENRWDIKIDLKTESLDSIFSAQKVQVEGIFKK